MVSTVTAAAYLTFKVRINVTFCMFGTLVSSYVHTSYIHISYVITRLLIFAYS